MSLDWGGRGIFFVLFYVVWGSIPSLRILFVCLFNTSDEFQSTTMLILIDAQLTHHGPLPVDS